MQLSAEGVGGRVIDVGYHMDDGVEVVLRGRGVKEELENQKKDEEAEDYAEGFEEVHGRYFRFASYLL